MTRLGKDYSIEMSVARDCMIEVELSQARKRNFREANENAMESILLVVARGIQKSEDRRIFGALAERSILYAYRMNGGFF